MLHFPNREGVEEFVTVQIQKLVLYGKFVAGGGGSKKSYLRDEIYLIDFLHS